jgi:tetratricopeptide (TPR) repeat protein
MLGPMRHFIIGALALGLMVPAALPARAESFEAGLARFAADSFVETEDAIGTVVASSHPMALRVIDALQDARLLYDPNQHGVFIRDNDRILSAVTGEPVAKPPPDLEVVRINNRLRRAIETALATLAPMRLASPDPGQRYEAAQAVFRSRDARAKTALETAIRKETDPRIRGALAQARAAILLMGQTSEQDRLDAVALIHGRGDQEAVDLLSALPADTPAAVAQAAATAVAAIERDLAVARAQSKLALAEQVYGPEHQHVAFRLNALASAYAARGRYGDAEPLYRRALAITEKALGPDHPDVGTSLGNLAGLYQAQGRYRDAEPLYRRAQAIAEKALSPDHADLHPIEIVPIVAKDSGYVAFSPDGARLVSIGMGGKIQLWDVATAALLRSFEGHAASVAFSPDGTTVIAGGIEELKLWDTATGRLVRSFDEHSANVISVAFSPEGTRAVSGGNDGKLSLWDIATGKLKRSIT